VRGHIAKAKYGDYFIHRTGHSIGTEVHANGANMDDLEIHDERRILPNSLFSVEPGIYLPELACAWKSMCWCGRLAPRSLVEFNKRS